MRKSLFKMLPAYALGLLSAVAITAFATTNFEDALNFRGGWSISGTSVTATAAELNRLDGDALSSGAAPGATCSAGQIFVDTDETDDTNCTTTADNSLCLCTAADTWTALENN